MYLISSAGGPYTISGSFNAGLKETILEAVQIKANMIKPIPMTKTRIIHQTLFPASRNRLTVKEIHGIKEISKYAERTNDTILGKTAMFPTRKEIITNPIEINPIRVWNKTGIQYSLRDATPL